MNKLVEKIKDKENEEYEPCEEAERDISEIKRKNKKWIKD